MHLIVSCVSVCAGTDVRTAPLGVWLGCGGRVVVDGSALLPGTSCKVTGLQKNSDYVARVTAVKKRRVVLPDGTPLEQTVESEPSPPTAYLRTLNPGAEIARLTDHNAALIAENARIPILENELVELEQSREVQVTALSDELSSTQEQLGGALGEIDRLQGELATRTAELEAARSEIKALCGSLETRDGELAEARAEIRFLNDVVATKTDEIARSHAAIERLNATVRDRLGDLERAGEGESSTHNVHVFVCLHTCVLAWLPCVVSSSV